MLLLPAFPRPSSLSPHSPLHSPSTRRKINGVSSSTVTATSLPDAKPLKLQYSQAACMVPGHQPTCLPNSICMESTTIEGAPVAEGLPEETNVGDSRKKRQRQKHAHHWQQFTRAQFPGGRFPAKFGCQPIKLELYQLAHTYPANYVRVHLRHLGVYKESRVAYRAIRVRVS